MVFWPKFGPISFGLKYHTTWLLTNTGKLSYAYVNAVVAGSGLVSLILEPCELNTSPILLSRGKCVPLSWKIKCSVITVTHDHIIKKCNLMLAMSPTCHSNNALIICWHEFSYTSRIAILLCICSSTYAWHVLYGAYAVYTPWCICSVSTSTVICVWCIRQWVYATYALWSICSVCVTRVWHILHEVYVE